jgi:hypothetical protein
LATLTIAAVGALTLSAGLISSASAATPTPVTTSALTTGPSAEQISTVPVYKEWDPSYEKVVYSLAIPSVRAGETLRATGNVELTGNHAYQISASARMVIGSDSSNAEGTVVTPRANTTFTPEMSRLTLPIDGLYNATADLGTQYLKLVLKAPAWEAKEGDSLSVVPDSGHLAVTRYAPTAGPTAVATHELQSCTTASEQITSIPVDWEWHSVLSCDMGEISSEDRLEPFGQLEVGNLNTANVKLESRVLAATTATGTAAGPEGWIIAPDTVDLLTPANRFARIVQSSEKPSNSASKHYVNLLVRALPVGGGSSFSPLTVNVGSAVMNVLRFKPNPGNPANSLLPGTFEQTDMDVAPDVASIPIAADGKEPVVVNSLPISGLQKGEVIRPQGMLTADLNGGGSAPVETELILADSQTDTTGEVISGRQGDTIPTSQQIHTIIKNGTYVALGTAPHKKYINLVAYASREPAEPGEKVTVSKASMNYARSRPVGRATTPTPVTTSALTTGPSAEQISTVPVYKEWDPSYEKVVYSLAIPSVRAGETLRATGNVELTGNHAYQISASARMVIGSDSSNAEGTVVTPRANTTFTPEMSRLTLPIDGLYNATADLGTQYLKLVLKAPAWEAKEGDSLSVVPDSGHLAVTRYAPTAGPTAVATHELQSCTTASEQITSIPVDWEWHSVLSCDMGEISSEDRLEPFGQLEVGNLNTANVKLESRVLAATTATGTAAGPEGWIIAPDTVDLLTPANRFARIVQSSEKPSNSASKHYVNLLVRALPVGGGSSFSPLTVNVGSAVMNVLRFKPNPGNPANSLLPGTFEQTDMDVAPDVASIPIAADGKEPVVVNSLPISGLQKGEVIRPQGMLTADLNGGGSAPVETELILADSQTDTTGEVISGRQGDTIPTSQQIHTIIKNGTYERAQASVTTKFLNLVAYANRQPVEPGESADVVKASVAYSRSKSRAAFSVDFEDGLLDQFFQYGQTNSVTENQSREGSRALQVDLDSSSVCEFCGGGISDPEGVRRSEIIPPDRESSGGLAGLDRWYGWSVYFPESFAAPQVQHSYFTGKIDEVRIYNQELSKNQIDTDKEGQYASGPTPVAAYSFSENSGSVVHDSSGEHNGVIENANWVSNGQYGSALEFNGLNSLVRVPDAPQLDLTEEFTIEAWVNPTKLRWWNPVVAKTDGLEPEASGYLLNAGFHEYPAGLVYASGSKKEVPDFSSKLPVNTWSHLAITSDGTNLRIYRDGVLKETRAANTVPPTQGDLMIGSNEFNPGYFRGPWNIFTQWHDSTDGFECSTNTAVPIAFSATGYRAGFQYQENEAPTPAEGDYIDIMLNGGEVEEVADGWCNALSPTQRHVLAPIRRGEWYDFVLHTRWTTEEGGPGNSVTSVWINGKQILGNESIPVAKPTLYWKGTPATHKSVNSWQFGLYRGGTAEDPPSRLFVDSARTGESYAEVAPERHAPRFESEGYPASFSVDAAISLKTRLGTVDCGDATFQGEVEQPAREIHLDGVFNECAATSEGLGGLSTNIDMNSCSMRLGAANSGPPYTGILGIDCEQEGDSIELRAYEGESLVCTVNLAAQEAAPGLALSNTGEGPKRGIESAGTAEGVDYDLTGVECAEEPGSYSDGELELNGTLTAISGTEQAGAYLTGHEFVPRIEAETYGAALSGNGVPELVTNLGTFKCPSTSLSGVAGGATSQVNLHASYAVCSITAGGTKYEASVTMNGCRYVLGVANVPSPYKGTWGVSCDNEGEAIEFRLTKDSLGCLKLYPQDDLVGVDLSVVGEGAQRAIGIDAELAGVKYEWTGVCGGGEVRTDGAFQGQATLSASDGEGTQVAIYLDGES